jgi:hypothetical protein
MAYTRINWNNTTTPIDDDNLNIMDRGIERTHARAMTTAQRNALTGDDLFIGRLIFNTNTGFLETWNGSSWISNGAPAVRVYPSSSQSIPGNGSLTTINFGSESFDNGTMHSTITNNSRLIAHEPGIYLITGRAAFSVSEIQILELSLRKNGSTEIASSHQRNDDSILDMIDITELAQLNAGNYVELRIGQTSSGSKGLNVGLAGNRTHFSMVRVADS